MTRGGAGALVALALATGLALRLARLDARPMHHDEANQAVKFGALLERGEYQYDAYDHHGPTLYYLTLPAAAARGQATLPSLDERTLRAVPAAFGAATILLLLPLSAAIGRTAVVSGAWLLALSPAMVFYSRMYIQEALFACFTLAFAISLGRAAAGGRLAWSIAAGIAAGLAASTKETAAIVLPAAVAAYGIAWWSMGSERKTLATAARPRLAAAIALAAAAAVVALFYSSFFTRPSGILDPLRAAGTYVSRGVDPSAHSHPWHYYAGLLAYSSAGGLRWTEGLVLLLAGLGAVAGWRRSHRVPAARTLWARYLTLNVVVAAAIFSAIRYKTPWNVLPFYAGAFAVAGIGLATLAGSARPRLVRFAITAGFLLGVAHLGWQAWRASVTYSADPRNPYVYAHTVPDAVRMAARIRAFAALHPDGSRMLVSVIAPPHEQWPLPWYLRTMPHVGYWTEPRDALAVGAPVVVASMEHTAEADQALGDRYVSEFFGLRPEVLLAVYVERGLWERFLAQAAAGAARADGTDPCATPEHCGGTPAVALWLTAKAP